VVDDSRVFDVVRNGETFAQGLGGILFVAGFMVTTEAVVVGENLVRNCGEDPLSHALQRQWTAAKEFYERCDKDFMRPIEHCKGFDSAAFIQDEDDRVLFDYLQTVFIFFIVAADAPSTGVSCLLRMRIVGGA